MSDFTGPLERGVWKFFEDFLDLVDTNDLRP